MHTFFQQRYLISTFKIAFFISWIFASCSLNAQNDQRPLKESGNGNDKQTMNVQEREASTKYESRITKKVPAREINRKSASLKGDKNVSLREYGGAYSMKSWKQRRSQSVKNNQKMADYRIKMAYTSQRKKRSNAQKMADFRGQLRITQQQPKGAKNSWQKPDLKKPIIYNTQKMKKGTKVKPSELPNYQKNAPKKIKYNSKESDWMRNGDGMRNEKVREKYLKERGKITY